jgi:hypothetical protein
MAPPKHCDSPALHSISIGIRQAHDKIPYLARNRSFKSLFADPIFTPLGAPLCFLRLFFFDYKSRHSFLRFPRIMIGRSNNLHRPRRSVRKYVWALAIIFVFCLWQSGTVSRRRATDPEATLGPLTSKTSPDYIEAIVKHESPIAAGHVGSRHVHPKPAPVLAADIGHLPSSHQSNTQAVNNRNRNAGSAGRGDSALTKEDDMEGHELDDIERLGEHRDDDSVEHAAKLTHPDDDGADAADSGAAAKNDGQGLPAANSHDLSKEQRVLKEDDIDDSEAPLKPQRSEGKQAPISLLNEQTPWSENYDFPSWDECQELKEKAESLPDLVHVPFEVSVKDVVLEGWEDEWIAKAIYKGPKLAEPKIDFVYTWVNGSQQELTATMKPYEINSSLNDADGVWMASHGSNRYREWDELRYSMRSVEKYAGRFTNRIQILVNAFKNSKIDESSPTTYGKQRPHWLRTDMEKVQVLSQEEFFGPEERKCLPSFDSLTIENQLYNTKSETDRVSLSTTVFISHAPC